MPFPADIKPVIYFVEDFLVGLFPGKRLDDLLAADVLFNKAADFALRLLLLLKHFRGQPGNKCRNKKRQRRDEHDNNGDFVVDGEHKGKRADDCNQA